MSAIKQSGQMKIQGLPEHIFTNDDLIDLPVEGSKIVEFYKGKYVFITGATGFLGKLLVEKLLRACTGIAGIFILVRAKHDKDVKTRVKNLYDDVVFSVLQKQQPTFRNKIHIVEGDTALPDLGINATDKQQIIEKVNVVFHGAATVRFDESLKKAIAINVRGTKSVIELIKQCKHLESVVYISTAYSHCPKKEIQEILYDPPISTEKSIELIEKWSEEELEIMTPKVLDKWPNTYSFSKAVAEDTMVKYAAELPLCIFRPAIIIATYKEPLQSWCDNLYGPTGIVIGSGTGVLKTLYCDKDKVADIVPADYVINGMIAASHKTTEKKKEIDVYNYVSSVENPITYDKFLILTHKYGRTVPPIQCIWCFCLTLNKNKYVDMLYTIFLHFIPALFMDGVAIAMGKPARMLKLYKKIHKFSSVLSYFSTSEWHFENKNVQNLWNYLSDADKYIFKFSMSEFDWEEFSQTHGMGLRTYLLKDDPSTLPAARIKWRRFEIMNQGFKILIRLLGLYLIYLILSKIYYCLF